MGGVQSYQICRDGRVSGTREIGQTSDKGEVDSRRERGGEDVGDRDRAEQGVGVRDVGEGVDVGIDHVFVHLTCSTPRVSEIANGSERGGRYRFRMKKEARSM